VQNWEIINETQSKNIKDKLTKNDIESFENAFNTKLDKSVESHVNSEIPEIPEIDLLSPDFAKNKPDLPIIEVSVCNSINSFSPKVFFFENLIF